MNEIEKKIHELYAIKDVIEQLDDRKKCYMTFDQDTETYLPPSVDDDYNYSHFEVLNDLIIELYVKAGIKPNKK